MFVHTGASVSIRASRHVCARACASKGFSPEKPPQGGKRGGKESPVSPSTFCSSSGASTAAAILLCDKFFRFVMSAPTDVEIMKVAPGAIMGG